MIELNWNIFDIMFIVFALIVGFFIQTLLLMCIWAMICLVFLKITYIDRGVLGKINKAKKRWRR